jgi:hypothetical protein
MPISNLYVLQYLIQSTKAGNDLQWRERQSGAYVARIRGIQLELSRIAARSGTRWYLTFARLSDKVGIEEPAKTGFFSETYACAEDQQVARLLKSLAAAINQQIVFRESRRAGIMHVIREEIYKRVIGTTPERSRSSPAIGEPLNAHH